MNNYMPNLINLNEIKLIVWDLDDTFWKGTLSEHNVAPLKSNIELVINLAKRGIISSICSKNDYIDVKKEFQKPIYQSVFDYFVFPSINWSAKGQRIKELIDNMQLRPTNVLFIDDNLSNLHEAEYYCKSIKISTPDIISDIENSLNFIGKDDHNLTRLNQYKLMERKHIFKENASSNDEFLKKSKIVASINFDCKNEIDRIYELINRTNQMNFTKIRLDKDELEKLLSNDSYENAYIKVTDKFGDYGIVGFYCYDKINNKLLHFLFSCRILGMGVDQAVYQKLNFPDINIIGEVSSKLEKEKYITHIKFVNSLKIKNKKTKRLPEILLKGPCDLSGILPYLGNSQNIECEFNKPGLYAYQHTCCIADSLRLNHDLLDTFLARYSFYSPLNYQTNLFNSKFETIVLSIIPDSMACCYKDKKTGIIFPMGDTAYNLIDANDQKTIIENGIKIWDYNFTKKELEDFSENSEYIGRIAIDKVIENLTFIREHLNKNTRLILILGSEKPTDKQLPNTMGLDIYHQTLNTLVRDLAKKYSNIEIINTTDFIKNDEDYLDCIVHYNRHVYFELATVIAEKISINKYVPTIKLINRNIQSLVNNYIKICSISVKLYIYRLLNYLFRRRSFNKRIHYMRKLSVLKKQNNLCSKMLINVSQQLLHECKAILGRRYNV